MPGTPTIDATPTASATGQRDVVIVGGGFSGVAVACALLRQVRAPLQVQLVERAAQAGRGLAYGSPDPAHLLNVPAGRMGLRADDEAGFARYLAAQGLPWGAADFAPRALYGRYLQAELAEHARQAAPGVQLLQLQGEVVACTEDGVTLADGRHLPARQQVLATGAWPLAWPGVLRGAAAGAGWIDNPWQPGALADVGAGDAVLLLGSGLTALDLLASLQGRGHQGRVTMLSRRGLLPQAHRGLGAAPPALAETAAALQGLKTLRQQLRAFRQRVQQATAAGHDWRDLLTGLRDTTPALWQALNDTERGRFLRHLQPFWDTHRHRAAPPVRAAAEAALRSGQLQVLAGRVLGVQARAGGGCVLQVRHRASGQVHPLAVRWVINCTGAGPVPRGGADTLWQGLLQAGQVRADAQGLGVKVDAGYRLIAADGRAQPQRYYIGPLLRAQHWEATAVIELRRHAQALAGSLLQGC